jgi:pimeloyl-ACP methyl ester carboxylesterase
MTLPIRNARIRLPQGHLFWREVGTGPTLLFLHGTWSDSSEWMPLLQQLGDRVHCLAPDLLGFGESEGTAGHYSISLEAECLGDYLEALRLSDVYLVGHSLGAWVAATYALQADHRVRGLVLIDPEGVESEAGRYPWRRSRGWKMRAFFHRLWRPVAMALGRHAQWRSHHQQYRQYRRSPVACELLFQRRWAEVQEELLSDRVAWLKLPLLVIQQAGATVSQGQMAAVYAQAPEAHLQVSDGAELSDQADLILDFLTRVMGSETAL